MHRDRAGGASGLVMVGVLDRSSRPDTPRHHLFSATRLARIVPSADELSGAAVLAVALGVAITRLLARLVLYLPEDMVRSDTLSGEFQRHGRTVSGYIRDIKVVARFDRPFADYWPFYRGYVDRRMCGAYVTYAISGLRPSYMWWMGELTFKSGALGMSLAVICSGAEPESDPRETRMFKHANTTFGSFPGDWEIELAAHETVLRIPFGSWLGNKVDDRIIGAVNALETMTQDDADETTP